MNFDLSSKSVISSEERKRAVADIITEGRSLKRRREFLQLATFHKCEIAEKTLNRTITVASFRDDDTLSLFARGERAALYSRSRRVFAKRPSVVSSPHAP